MAMAAERIHREHDEALADRIGGAVVAGLTEALIGAGWAERR